MLHIYNLHRYMYKKHTLIHALFYVRHTVGHLPHGSHVAYTVYSSLNTYTETYTPTRTHTHTHTHTYTHTYEHFSVIRRGLA